MDRYYLVKIKTNTPDHKLDRVDEVFAKEVRLQFSNEAEVFQVNAGNGKIAESVARPISGHY